MRKDKKYGSDLRMSEFVGSNVPDARARMAS